jgi:tRNA 2-selenouridine synthase
MILPVDPKTFPELAKQMPVVDVRAPVEFVQGHIPGAYNVALFNDAERAMVGTIYRNSGREAATLKGLELALPKTQHFITQANEVAPGKRMLLHCWRGGMRSAAMAEVFSASGFEVYLLDGGYKAYRRFVREELSKKARIVILGGYTGSGKTELLDCIGRQGEQVIDLEKLACHKGSVFGAMGQGAQPTNEQFENDLFLSWSQLDFSRLVWLEDESRRIGHVTLPEPVFKHISEGLLVRVSVPEPKRVERLVHEYSRFGFRLLSDAIIRIEGQLGGTRTREALNALAAGDYGAVASIALAYYDKSYQFSIERHRGRQLPLIEANMVDPESDAGRIIKTVYQFLSHESDLS